MPLLRLIRRLFPKIEPQTVILDGLGEVTSDRCGFWTARQPITLNSSEVGLCFKLNDAAPGGPEIAAYQAVVGEWPRLWSSIISRLQSELEVDDPNGERARFFDQVRPVFLCFIDGFNLWEVGLQPDIYQGHIVTMLMEENDCVDFRLDG